MAGVLLVVLLLAWPAHSQVDETPFSHPFAFGLNGGESATPDTKVYDLRIPVGYTLIPQEQRKWGLRLRMVLYAGVYNFSANEAIDLDLKFQSLGATPGVEFLVPAGAAWTLKPFAEVGYLYDYENKLGFGVWSFGMRTIATWPVKRFDLSFGTKLQYFSTFTSGLKLADEYGEIRLGFDARHPLGFTIKGARADISLFFIRRQYFNAIINQDDIDPLEIRYTNELGFTFGTTPSAKLWFFRLPRVGLGYRWGPNSRGIRLNFGFPF